uniref:Membrane-associated protein TcaA n=1 Tax=Lygus hesperus TaxID=30085 RepID=A0A0A9Y3J6_LYGHE
MGKSDSSLTLVLPITNATNSQDLLKILNTYGHCVTFKDALDHPEKKKRIIVGKVIREFHTYEDSYNYHRKVYHLKSVIPGDPAHFRFVASGKRMVQLVVDNLATTIGDYLALYEPSLMASAADLPAFYFPSSTSTLWVCKDFESSNQQPTL